MILVYSLPSLAKLHNIKKSDARKYQNIDDSTTFFHGENTLRSTKGPALANRLQAIPPFHVMEVVRIAEELESQGWMLSILKLGSLTSRHQHRSLSMHAALYGHLKTRYTDARGIESLRDALSNWYQSKGLVVPSYRIQITVGASGGLLLAFAATTDPGNRVLMADPAYPCNPRFVEAVGGDVHWIKTDATTYFQPTLSQLIEKATDIDRTLILAHPANPTGQAVPQVELEQMSQWCQRTNRHLIVDEIYQNLLFNDALISSLAISEQHFVVGSFSKYFNMTGWRLEKNVIPEYALEATQRLAQHLFICAPSFAQ